MPSPDHPPKPPGAPQPQPAMPPWRPVSTRQKLRLAALTLAMVAGLTYVLQRPHQQLIAEKAARHAAACQGPVASRPGDCPGGPMAIQVLPVAPSASGQR